MIWAHIVLAIITLCIAVIFHEMGHWWYFNHAFKKDVKFTLEWKPTKIPHISIPNIIVGEARDYYGMNSQQKMNLYLSGIMFGLFPIFFMSCFVSVYHIFLLVLYFQGCGSDMNELFKLIKNRHKELKEVMKE